MDNALTAEDYKTLMRAMRHLPGPDHRAFGAVINKLKSYVYPDDDFINDFNHFYAEAVRNREERRKYVTPPPQAEVRMTAKWGRRDEPDPELF